MVLNYHSTNCIGWPIPAFYYGTKIQKLFELCKYFYRKSTTFFLIYIDIIYSKIALCITAC